MWAPHLAKDIHEIENVQRRASRIALGQKKQEMAYEDRCKILKWNSFERRREFLSLVECYKIVFNLNGLNFSDYFELCKSTKTISNHQYKIQTKLAKLNCYKYSFFVKIIKFWNDLPSNVINCHDGPKISKFKLRLKNHKNIYCMYILTFVKDVSVIFVFLLTCFCIMYKFLLYFYCFNFVL